MSVCLWRQCEKGFEMFEVESFIARSVECNEAYHKWLLTASERELSW